MLEPYLNECGKGTTYRTISRLKQAFPNNNFNKINKELKPFGMGLMCERGNVFIEKLDGFDKNVLPGNACISCISCIDKQEIAKKIVERAEESIDANIIKSEFKVDDEFLDEMLSFGVLFEPTPGKLKRA